MLAIEEVVGIWVGLHVGGQQALFALVLSDGSVNRMGSGLVNASDREMFIGKASPELFQQLRSKITPGVIHFLGQRLAAPNPIGKHCELTVGLKYADGREAASAWRYGSESQGPHPEVVDFVKETLQITEPWFQRQTAMVARPAAPTR
jgi:hypothetical protein